MPFIKQERRDAIANNALKNWEVGDMCYVHYAAMVYRWKKAPSWKTAHAMYRDLVLEGLHCEPFKDTDISNQRAAKLLAWEVFFQLHIMPYELKKREENGDI